LILEAEDSMIKTTQIKTEVMRVERKYHEIDDSVKIDFEVPKILQSLIDEAEEADLADNFGSYENIADTIDVYCKDREEQHAYMSKNSVPEYRYIKFETKR
jgi:hypothetical protein